MTPKENVFVARRLVPDPVACVLSGPTGLVDQRPVERNGRIRYDNRGRPYLIHNGRQIPVISGAVLGASLPSRLANSSGTNYYTATTGNDSTGDGSTGNPWQTVQKAVNTVPANSIINVRSCTAEKLYILGDMASTVTIQPEGYGTSWTRKKLHNVWVENSPTVATRNWRIRGFEFDGAATAVNGSGFAGFGCNIKPNGSATRLENIEMDNCWLHDHGHVIQSGANSASCLFLGGSGRAALTGIQIWNSVMVNPGLEIYAVGDQTTSTDLFVTTVDPANVDPALYFKAAGGLYVYNSAGALQYITYTGQDAINQKFTGCSGWTGTILGGTPITDSNRNEDHGIYIEGSGAINTPDVLIANCIIYDIRSGYGVQLYPNPKNVWVVNTLVYGNLSRSGYVITSDSSNTANANWIKNSLAVRNIRDNGLTAYRHVFNASLTASPVNRWDYCLGFNNPGGNFSADYVNGLVSSNLLTGSDPLFNSITNPHSVQPPSSTLYLPPGRDFHVQPTSPDLGAGDAAYCPEIYFDGSFR